MIDACIHNIDVPAETSSYQILKGDALVELVLCRLAQRQLTGLLRLCNQAMGMLQNNLPVRMIREGGLLKVKKAQVLVLQRMGYWDEALRVAMHCC